MNIKVKAGLIVAGIMTTAGITMLGLQLAFTYIPVEVLGKIGMGVILGGLLMLMYTMVLEQLKTSEKYKNKLKDIVDQKR